jgi:transcriptional regulator with XRE-family HTH domain
MTRRTAARRLGIGVAELKHQEQKTTDLPLSVLYKWQRVLNVPLEELLVEPDDSLSPPLMKRAQLVQLMKTAVSITEQAQQTSIKRLAQTLIAQLTEIMPELREVNSWPVVGQRRRRSEYGQAVERSLPEETFTELAHDTTPQDWT